MTSYIPNSFQTPNAIVDDLMQHLSGNELKVFLFTVRHIYGFQDKIERGQAYISVTMYEKGYSKFNGVGLSRPTIVSILKELTDYGVLVPVGEPTQFGQLWSIGEKPDINGLETRSQKASEKTKPKLKKARKARGKTVKPVVKGINQEQLNGLTDGGKTVLLNQTHSQTHSQTQNTLTPNTSNEAQGVSGDFLVTKSGTVHSVKNGVCLCRESIQGEITESGTVTCKSCLKKLERLNAPPRLNKATTELKNYVAEHFFKWDLNTITGSNWGEVMHFLNQVFNVHEQYQTICQVDSHLKGFKAWYHQKYPNADLPRYNAVERHYATYYAEKKREQDKHNAKIIATQEATMPDEIENIPTPPEAATADETEPDRDFSVYDWGQDQIAQLAVTMKNKNYDAFKADQAKRKAAYQAQQAQKGANDDSTG
jgi:hypothetical protein